MSADIGFCLPPSADQRQGINQHLNALGVPFSPPRWPVPLAPQRRMQPSSSSPRRLCPHNADPAETGGTPHSGRCNTPPPPAVGHTAARKYFRCGRLLLMRGWYRGWCAEPCVPGIALPGGLCGSARAGLDAQGYCGALSYAVGMRGWRLRRARLTGILVRNAKKPPNHRFRRRLQLWPAINLHPGYTGPR